MRDITTRFVARWFVYEQALINNTDRTDPLLAIEAERLTNEEATNAVFATAICTIKGKTTVDDLEGALTEIVRYPLTVTDRVLAECWTNPPRLNGATLTELAGALEQHYADH